MIISRTPFRISFFGGGTDYPVFFKEHGGAVLGTTIDKYCYISLRYLPPYFEHKSKVVYSKFEYVNDNADIKHETVRECLKLLGIKDGIEIYHHSDLPAMRGLGSSSSFAVGLLNALYTLTLGYEVSSDTLASDAVNLEQHIMRQNVGCQDQYHAAFGGFNIIEFTKDDYKITPVDKGQLEKYLMLFDTGTYRVASEIAGAQIERTPRLIRELSEMKDLVYHGEYLLGKGDYFQFGRFLNESWQIKRELTDKISTPRIDGIYESALKAGAIGGKLLGAGGGGYILFFVEPDKQGKVKEALGGLTHVSFGFSDEGSKIIFDDSS